MGTIRVIASAVVCAGLAVGGIAAGPEPVRPASLERCRAAGATCVERSVTRDGDAVESRLRLASPAPGPSTRAERPRLIVEFAPRRLGRELATGRLLRELPRTGVSIVEVRDGFDVDAAIAELRARGDVLHVERDAEVTLLETIPEDPLWIEQWGMRTIGAPAAWDRGTEAMNVVVAVLDTGVDLDHRDLGESLWVAPDGTRGYNCVTGESDVTDDHGHGTHVAGIIGAVANADGDPSNDQGVAGVAWRAQLYPMKFLDIFGTGRVSDAIACFERIESLRAQGANIRVTNNSWGGRERSFLLRRAMARLGRQGVVHVAAAGNDGLDVDVFPIVPASLRVPGLIAVGSSGISDVPSPFTNHGLASVDIAAPGEYVMSTIPGSGYAYGSGTSAAAPHVAGVVASVLHSRPGWTARRVRDLLLDPANTAPSTLASSSGGRLDFASVREAVDAAGEGSPAFNRPPRFAAGWWFPPLVLAAGESRTVDASASDADGDDVTVLARRPRTVDLDTLEPLAWRIGQLVPQPVGTSIELDAPPLDAPLSVPFVISAADGRGGSIRRQFFVTMPAAGDPAPPSIALVPSTAAPAVGEPFVLAAAVTDPDGGDVVWGYECHGAQGGFGAFDPGATDYARTVFIDGRFRCRAYAVDEALNLTVSDDLVIAVGEDGREPPTARLSLDRESGAVPLTVTLDASASTDVDGTIVSYAFACGATGVVESSLEPVGSCTFRRPGPHVVRVTVVDDQNRADSIALPVMALPRGTP